MATRRLLNRNVLINLKELPHHYKHTRCISSFYHTAPIVCHRNQAILCSTIHPIRLYSTQSKEKGDGGEKPSLFQKFKQMYKDYWYVLVPVHLVTSAAWFGGFYYLAKSGVDVVALLESLHVSERVINPIKDSSMGYLALTYALYKIATPARYTVTLGGTTISINYLQKWGYIKPVPSKEKLKEIYQEQKDNLLETMRETREEFKVQSEKLKDKKENIMDDLDKGIKQIKVIGDKIKSKEENVMSELKKKITDKKN